MTIIDCTPIRKMRPDVSLLEIVKIHESRDRREKLKELLLK